METLTHSILHCYNVRHIALMSSQFTAQQYSSVQYNSIPEGELSVFSESLKCAQTAACL